MTDADWTLNRFHELVLALTVCEDQKSILDTLAVSVARIMSLDHLVILPRDARPGDESRLVTFDAPGCDPVSEKIDLAQWQAIRIDRVMPVLIDDMNDDRIESLFSVRCEKLAGMIGISLFAPGVNDCLLVLSHSPVTPFHLDFLMQIGPLLSLGLASARYNPMSHAPEKRKTAMFIRPVLNTENRTESGRNAARKPVPAGIFTPDFIIDALTALRRPMTALAGFGQVLAVQLNGRPEDEYSGEILRHSHQLMELSNDLLILARAENGTLTFYSGMTVEPTDLIARTAAGFRQEIEGKGLAFTVDIAEDIPSPCFTDGNLISKLVMTLLVNAIQTTQRGTIRLTADWEPVDDDTVMLAVAVKDTGAGYRSNELSGLFEPYRYLKIVDSRIIHEERGSGLKMPIAYRLARAFGGNLTVESSRGLGSTFTVKLPMSLKEPETGALEDAEEEYRKHPRREGPVRVLVIDNHVTFRMGAVEMLKANGYEAFEARDARRGIAFLQQHDDIEVALIDLELEPLDGFETARKIRSRPESDAVVLVALTARDGEEDRAKAAGFNDVLGKPLAWPQLNRALIRWTKR